MELIHRLYLKSRGKLHVRCLLHETFLVVYWVLGLVRFTSLHVQDHGVFECNRSERAVLLHEVQSDAM